MANIATKKSHSAPKNPVLSQDTADTVVKTFVSALPKLPIGMMGPREVAAAKLNIEEDSSLDEADRKRLRLALSKRDTMLLERELAGGWFDFGQPTKIDVVRTPRGMQYQITNYRKQTLKCNVNKYNLRLLSDLDKAILIADTKDQSVYLMTSAFGDYRVNEWFDSIWVKFKDTK
jgi:hypothetical protein